MFVCIELGRVRLCFVVSEDDFEPEKDPKREKKENFGSKQICAHQREKLLRTTRER